jgi:hypothetical protein
MGMTRSLVLYAGEALAIGAFGDLYAGVTAGRLGDTTLAIRHLARVADGLNAVATYELTGRYKRAVSETDIAHVKRLASVDDRSLSSIVQAAWKIAHKTIAENRLTTPDPARRCRRSKTSGSRRSREPSARTAGGRCGCGVRIM